MIDLATTEFLKDVSGVIHVGASYGQERDVYDQYKLDVVWVEPTPRVFKLLAKRIRNHPKQKAFRYLVTDMDDKEYKFHISNNRCESSSILEFKDHYELWPDITYVKTIALKGITLTTLCRKEKIDVSKYEALVLDTQGTEMLVLKGVLPILDNFKYIKTEALDFEAYKDGCLVGEIESFMQQHGYREIARRNFALKKGRNHGYDIVYKKNDEF
jgi:FkbM family methyltransferase